MTGRWRVPDSVRALLGGEVDSLADEAAQDATLTCQFCKVGPDEVRGAVDTIVVLGIDSSTGPMVGLAHSGCAPDDGVVSTDGTLQALTRDDHVVLGQRGNGGWPSALYVLQHGMRGFLSSRGRVTNAFASAMLGRGFELLLRADVATVEPELAFGWSLSRSERSLVLTDPDGTVLCSSASDDTSRWWETLAASEGQVLVVAGTDLGMAPDGNPGPARLEEAVRAGRVVVARVRFSG